MSVRSEGWNTLVLGHREAPRLSVLTAVLVPCAVANTALIAVGQRWLVDSANAGLVGSALLGAAVAALGLGIGGSIGRVMTNLRLHLGHEAGRLLTREAFTLIARRRDHQLLADPGYADDVEVLRKHALTLGSLGWTGVVLAAQSVGIVIALLLLGAVHPVLGLAAVLVVLPVLLSLWGQRRTRAADEAVTGLLRQERELHAIGTLADRVGEPRAYGVVPELDAYATRLWEDALRQRAGARTLGALATVAGWVCFGAGLAAGLTVLGHGLAAGTSTIGDLLLVVTLTTGLRLEISYALLELDALTDGLAAARALGRVRAAADLDHRGDPPPARLTDALVAEKVSFTYAGAEHPALREVSLRIPAGTVLAVIGRNGAGKSTLVDLLTGTLTPTAGRVLLDGADLAGIDLRAGPPRISGAFQDFLRPPVLLGESVGLGDRDRVADEAAILRAVAVADARAIVAGAADGLGTKLSPHDGMNPSQGQWQKLAVARAQMNDTPLIVALDEPSSALDPAAEHAMVTAAVARARELGRRTGTITLLVSHRLASAAVADHIVTVEDGRVAESGTHLELMARDGHYRRLFDEQRTAYR